ncbi:MAG: universal stress protein [Ilumatobacteraceae bacterium]
MGIAGDAALLTGGGDVLGGSGGQGQHWGTTPSIDRRVGPKESYPHRRSPKHEPAGRQRRVRRVAGVGRTTLASGCLGGQDGAGGRSSRWRRRRSRDRREGVFDMSILVGVDGSEGGRAALRWASEWSRRSDTPLVAASSWQYPSTAALPGAPQLGSPDEMDRAVSDELHSTLVDELGADADEVRAIVERGPASWALLDLASRIGARMLVVGKRGLGPLEGRLLGSVSRRVAEMASCPVVIVPPSSSSGQRTGDDAGRPVVIGVDGSPASERALEIAIDVAKRWNTSVVLVHGLAGLPPELSPSSVDRVVAGANDLVDRLAERVTDAGVTAETYVDVADPRTLIDAVAGRRDARLIVVGAAGDGPVSGRLVGSVVNHVVQQSDRPVVVVP